MVFCPNCGGSNVILKTNVSDVKFQFDEKSDVVLLSDVADSIYWGVVYDKVPAKCSCHDCGYVFDSEPPHD